MSTQPFTAFSIPLAAQGMSLATFTDMMPFAGIGAGTSGAFLANPDVFMNCSGQPPAVFLVSMPTASDFYQSNVRMMAPTAVAAYSMSQAAMGAQVENSADVVVLADSSEIHPVGARGSAVASDSSPLVAPPSEAGANEVHHHRHHHRRHGKKGHVHGLPGGSAKASAPEAEAGGASVVKDAAAVLQKVAARAEVVREGQPEPAAAVPSTQASQRGGDEIDLNVVATHSRPRWADVEDSRRTTFAGRSVAIYNDTDIFSETPPMSSPNDLFRASMITLSLAISHRGRGEGEGANSLMSKATIHDAARAAVSVFTGRDEGPSAISSAPFDASDGPGDVDLNGVSVELTPTDGSQHVVANVVVGDIPLKRHYVKVDGRYVFAGWHGVHESPATALPEPARDSRTQYEPFASDDLRVFSVGMPGGESAYRLPVPEDSDLAVEEKFLAAVMEQLADGPDSLSSGKTLEDFNRFLRMEGRAASSDLLARSDWENSLKETLRLALRYTPVFGASGARDIAEISADAAMILGIDGALFGEWESFFGIDAMTAQLTSDESPYFSNLSASDIQSRLLGGLEGGIGMKARRLLPISDSDSILGREEETEIEWQVARISILDSRIDVAHEHMMALMEYDNIRAAGRELALIVRHSNLDGQMAGEEFIPRWNEVEVRTLIKLLMSGKAWSVASHRAFRMHLSPRENMLINAFIAGASENDISIGVIRKIDVTQVSWEEFCRRMDQTGRGDELLNRALHKMATAVGQ